MSTATTKTTQHSQSVARFINAQQSLFLVFQRETTYAPLAGLNGFREEADGETTEKKYTQMPSDESFITHQEAFPYQWRIAKTADNQGTLENCITFHAKCLVREPVDRTAFVLN